jgi:hypothetical protein
VPRFPSYVGVRVDVELPSPAAASAPSRPLRRRTFARGRETWAIELDGAQVLTASGDREARERCADPAAAAATASRMIREKVAGGFKER